MTRQMPNAIEAERALIGSLLERPDLLPRAADLVTVEDFTRKELRAIWGAIERLDADGFTPDVVGVLGALRAAGDEVDPMVVRDLAADVPVPDLAPRYAALVAEASTRRRLIHKLADATETAWGGTPPAEIAAELSDDLLPIVAPRGVGGATLVDLTSQVLNDLEANEGRETVGVPTGFLGIDSILGGLRPGWLTLVAARPGVGKTSFVGDVARTVARRTGPVLFFSLEMTADEIAMRLVCSTAGVGYHAIRTGNARPEDWTRLLGAIDQLAIPLTIVDRPEVRLAQMRAMARRTPDLALVVVDYLQLLTTADRRQNRQEEVAEISRGLKVLARTVGVPVLACSQLNRGVENRQDKRPQLSDLRESGALEQDADVVMMLHRDDQNPNHAEAIIAKHRSGPTGSVKLSFDRELTSFADRPVTVSESRFR